MREKCLDIGTIQAFLDGELTSDVLENAAQHISVCSDCALQLATAEEETSFAYSALEQEFNTLVPTQRLWAKINCSIENERKPFWHPVLAFFKNPTVATFASLLIVFGLFIGYLNSGKPNENDLAIKDTKKPIVIENIIIPVPVKSVEKSNPTNTPEKNVRVTSSTEQSNKNYRVVNANLDVKESKRKTAIQNAVPNNTPKTPTATYSYLPGEESYIKTIATLEKTVDSRKDVVLKPSAQYNFAKNIALVDDSINKMKSEVKKNPKNEIAKQLLMASYQNKVDLLNSVAEKTELMASVK